MTDDGHQPRLNPLAAHTDQCFLRALDDSGDPLSRAEIAAATGISKPAISDAAVRLERSELIVDAGVRGGRRGGVATLYRINGSRGHSLALGLQPTGVSVRARDLAGHTLFDRAEALPPSATTDDVVALANRLIRASADAARTELISAAVSVAVPVDSSTGDTVRLPNSPFPAGQFNPLRELALAPTGPAIVDNDVNWATIAERHLGSMTACEDFVYVYLGTGIGAGVFASGALVRGSRGLAGEIGYLRTPTGRDLTQTLALLGLGSADAYGIDLEAAVGLLSRTPPSEAGERAIDELATAIVNATILVNPRAVVLGGPLTASARLVDGLARRIPGLALDPPEVIVSTHAPLEGAAFEAHRLARVRFGF
ncbi:ROK family transcriptional regulator [Lacisediminihabitans profunda]|uniref:ROK family transcriptional regulator n=1 Tax=Lacisediminihabitans profunda TaxID=2594790 RepID=A0A5C8UJS6_9MICO|nr:ROK family transcriptional regulator [Lacisediminihabitans profunda]TXN28316.1 ROK family transcriptional regulator [Lacisediminihabitans profunda]